MGQKEFNTHIASDLDALLANKNDKIITKYYNYPVNITSEKSGHFVRLGSITLTTGTWLLAMSSHWWYAKPIEFGISESDRGALLNGDLNIATSVVTSTHSEGGKHIFFKEVASGTSTIWIYYKTSYSSDSNQEGACQVTTIKLK